MNKNYLLSFFFLISFSTLSAETEQNEILNQQHHLSVGLSSVGKGVMAGPEHSITYRYQHANAPLIHAEIGGRDVDFKIGHIHVEDESTYFKVGAGFAFLIGEHKTLAPYLMYERESFKSITTNNKIIGLEYLNSDYEKIQWGIQGEYKIFDKSESIASDVSLVSFTAPFRYYINKNLSLNASPNLAYSSLVLKSGSGETTEVKLGVTIGVGVHF